MGVFRPSPCRRVVNTLITQVCICVTLGVYPWEDPSNLWQYKHALPCTHIAANDSKNVKQSINLYFFYPRP